MGQDKIIFLDIDGVLNSEQYFLKRYRNTKDLNMINIDSLKENDYRVMLQLCDIDLDSLNNLLEIIDLTNSKVVIISTWKRLVYYEKIKKHLINLGLPIIGETNDNSLNRGEGIRKYLDVNNVDNYIILDDEIFTDYDEELLSHLIKTSFKEGLIENNIIESIELLNSKDIVKSK